MKSASEALSTAVEIAERRAGERIDQVIISISGGTLTSQVIHTTQVSIGNKVLESDLQRVMAVGREEFEQVDDDSISLIHSISLNYLLDKDRIVKYPLGLSAWQMGAAVHMVGGESHVVDELIGCVQRSRLEVAHCMVASYASGLACLMEEELDRGTVCIELGGEVTSLAVFLKGNLVFVGGIPLGANNLTKDIAQGFNLPWIEAEHVKLAHGFAANLPIDSYSIEIFPIGNARYTYHISSEKLIKITQAHLFKLFGLVQEQLDRSGLDQQGGYVVLSGGGSKLPGIRELARASLRRQVRLGVPNQLAGLFESTGGRDPGLATAIGLLLFASQIPDAEESGTFHKLWHQIRSRVSPRST